MRHHPVKKYPTLGCCGLDCGLCPKYYTEGSSKCPGCCGPDFFNKHPSCSYITCCVNKKQLEVCGQCDEFPCAKIEPALTAQYDSFLTYKNVPANLNFIKKNGIEEFIEQQRKRIRLLETMIKKYDDGRSRSYYCTAATLLPIIALEKAIEGSEKKIKSDKIGLDDKKTRSKILRGFLDDLATGEGIDLKLRKKAKD